MAQSDQPSHSVLPREYLHRAVVLRADTTLRDRAVRRSVDSIVFHRDARSILAGKRFTNNPAERLLGPSAPLQTYLLAVATGTMLSYENRTRANQAGPVYL
jgi:hypothetical protein